MAKTSLAFLFLSSSLMSALGDPVSFPSPPDTGLTCFLSDKAYTGTVVMTHSAGCSLYCQKKCETDKSCLFWTYSPDSMGGNDCILYSSQGTIVPAGGKISGPKRCFEPYHCVQTDFEASNNVVKDSMKTNDSYGCHQECKGDIKCRFSNYSARAFDARSNCYLKPSTGMDNPVFYSAGVTAMPRDCSEGWCYSYGHYKECSGSNQIEVLNNIPNARKCQESCRLKNLCYLWSWNKGGDKRCYLNKRECANNVKVEDAKAVTGLKRCGSGPVCHESYDYPGGDITSVRANNAEECNDHCFLNHRCHYFSYCPSDKMCWLKSAEAVLRRTAHRDRISGPAICGNTPTCAEANVKPSGTDLTQKRNIRSEVDCADECKRTPSCTTFTWNMDGSCWLKSDAAGAYIFTRKNTSARSITSSPQCYVNLSF